jgi:hypothetical protein
VQNAGDHPANIDPPDSTLVLGEGGSMAAHASSDNQNSAMQSLRDPRRL